MRSVYIILLRSLVSCVLVILFSITSANAQGWQWSQFGGGPQSSISQAVATDRNGNVFVAGSFLGDTMLVGGIILANAGNQNIFLVKYSPSGTVLWAKRYGGMYTDGATALATDTLGNVYIAGYFASASLKFDTSVIQNYFQNYVEGGASTPDGFVAKVDSSGLGVWVKDIGGIGDEQVNALCVGPSGDITVCGSFSSDTLIIGGDTLRTAGADDIFLIRYNSLGGVIWKTSAGGLMADRPYSLAVDTGDNVYVAGNFGSTSLSFGSTVLTNTYGVNHVFLAKYSNTGLPLWATSAGMDKDAQATSVVLDNAGYPYMVGTFSSARIFFGADTLHNSTSFGNMFFVKYNLAGNMLWLRGAAASENVYPQSVVCDSAGFLYCSGYYSSATVTFGSAQVINSGSVGYADVFLGKFTDAGDAVWVASAGGAYDDVSYAASADRLGNIYISGYFSGPDFSLGLLEDTSAYGTDFFVARFNPGRMAVTQVAPTKNEISLWPDPANDHIYINSGAVEVEKIQIIDAVGRILYMSNQPKNEQTIEIGVASFPAGFYTLSANFADGSSRNVKFMVNRQ